MGLAFRQAIPIGNGIAFQDAPERFDYTAELCLEPGGCAGVHIGVSESGDGYALVADAKGQCLHFMERSEGMLLDRGMKRIRLKSGVWYPVRAAYDGMILRLWVNENPLDKEPWPKFEFPLSLPGQRIGLEGAEFRRERLQPLEPAETSGESFTNPVAAGADPDVLFYEGKYYLYNRIPNDPNSQEDAYLFQQGKHAGIDEAGSVNAIFRVSVSEDLVHWSQPHPVLYRTGALEGAFCMSPNVFHKDGYFYLLFAAGRFRGEEDFHVYYAVSTSPEGPFEMGTEKPLHQDAEEIGGMPFVDTDGQCYITYVRFNDGNHIYLQRIRAEEGLITPEDETLVHVLSPEKDYEMDEYGKIVEGGVIIPHNGKYYMIYACGHYKGHYGEAYAVADHIFGPYRRYEQNPILHHHFQADGTGDGIVVYNADRSKMYLGYHRHISTEDIEPRMTCFDPMKFVPDPEGGPDILTVRGPSVVPQPLPFT